MSMDVEYEVEEPDGTLTGFGTLEEALGWCDEHYPDGGCSVRRKDWTPLEDL